jgi:hypothetical protein
LAESIQALAYPVAKDRRQPFVATQPGRVYPQPLRSDWTKVRAQIRRRAGKAEFPTPTMKVGAFAQYRDVPGNRAPVRTGALKNCS